MKYLTEIFLKSASIILAVLVLCSCNKDLDGVTKTEMSDVAVSDTLLPTPLPTLGKNLTDPRIMTTAGKNLVFIENAKADILKFFSLQDLVFAGSYGQAGQGPGEFGIPPFPVSDEPKKSPYLTLLDWSKKVLYKINTKQLVNTQEFNPEYQFLIPPELIDVQRAVYIPKDSTIIGHGGENRGKLFKYDIASDTVLTFTSFIPKFPEMENVKRGLGYLYAGEMIVNKELGKIVLISSKFNQIEYYDFDLNLLHISRMEENPTNTFEKGPNGLSTTENTVINFTDFDFNSERIFILDVNRTALERSKGKCGNESQVLELDWSGKLLNRFQLKGCPTAIAYDYINDRIFGLNPFADLDGKSSLVSYYQL
jgi:hypothetical protein